MGHGGTPPHEPDQGSAPALVQGASGRAAVRGTRLRKFQVQWAFCTAGATIVSGGVAERVKSPTYAVYAFCMTSFISCQWTTSSWWQGSNERPQREESDVIEGDYYEEEDDYVSDVGTQEPLHRSVPRHCVHEYSCPLGEFLELHCNLVHLGGLGLENAGDNLERDHTCVSSHGMQATSSRSLSTFMEMHSNLVQLGRLGSVTDESSGQSRCEPLGSSLELTEEDMHILLAGCGGLGGLKVSFSHVQQSIEDHAGGESGKRPCLLDHEEGENDLLVELCDFGQYSIGCPIELERPSEINAINEEGLENSTKLDESTEGPDSVLQDSAHDMSDCSCSLGAFAQQHDDLAQLEGLGLESIESSPQRGYEPLEPPVEFTEEDIEALFAGGKGCDGLNDVVNHVQQSDEERTEGESGQRFIDFDERGNCYSLPNTYGSVQLCVCEGCLIEQENTKGYDITEQESYEAGFLKNVMSINGSYYGPPVHDRVVSTGGDCLMETESDYEIKNFATMSTDSIAHGIEDDDSDDWENDGHSALESWPSDFNDESDSHLRDILSNESELENIVAWQSLRGGVGGGQAAQKRQKFEHNVLNTLKENLQAMLEALIKLERDGGNLDDFCKQAQNLAGSCERMVMDGKRNEASSESPSVGPKLPSYYTLFSNKPLGGNGDNRAGGQGGGKGKGGRGKGKKGTNKGDAGNSTMAKFDLVSKFAAKDIIPWTTVMENLENGKTPQPGVTVCNMDAMADIIQLAKLHEINVDLIILARKEDGKAAPDETASLTWVPVIGNQAVVAAWTATLKKDGKLEPWVQIEKKAMAQAKPAAPDLVTLRAVSPLFLWGPDEEEVRNHEVSILGKAKLLEKGEEIQTQGWERRGDFVVFYLKIPKGDEDKYLNKSGLEKPIFISKLAKDVVKQRPVKWITTEEGESAYEYFERAKKEAKSKNTTLSFRRGGGNYLGVRVDAEEAGVCHSWVLWGSPLHRGPCRVQAALEEQGWTVQSVPQCNRRRWTVIAIAPEADKESFFYKLAEEGAEDNSFITIKRWRKQRKVEDQRTRITGPRWWKPEMEKQKDIDMDTKGQSEVAPTVIDATLTQKDDVQEEAKGEKRPSDSANNVEPKVDKVQKTEAGKKVKKSTVVNGMPGPGAGHFKTTVKDLGGSGHCGWLALSYALAQVNGKTPTEITTGNNLENLAKSLHLRVSNFVCEQWQEWQEEWSPGDLEPYNNSINSTTEAGPPAKNLQEFLQVLKRPYRWVCGLMLAGFVRAKKVNLVVWRRDDDGWEREAIMRWSPTAPTIAVVRQGNHYFGLTKPARGYPTSWTDDKDEVEEIIFTQSEWSRLRAGVKEKVAPCTPVKLSFTDAEQKEWLDEAMQTPRSTQAVKTFVKDALLTPTSSSKPLATDGNVQKTFTWECKFCTLVLKGTVLRKHAQRVVKHLNQRHRDECDKQRRMWMANGYTGYHCGLGIRGCVEAQKAVVIKKNEDVWWRCPYCNKGLRNKEGAYAGRRSKRIHLRVHNKTLQQAHVDGLKKFKWSSTKRDKIIKKKMEKARKNNESFEEKGHAIEMISVIGKRGVYRFCHGCLALFRNLFDGQEENVVQTVHQEGEDLREPQL